jgi:hypothetical protein
VNGEIWREKKTLNVLIIYLGIRLEKRNAVRKILHQDNVRLYWVQPYPKASQLQLIGFGSLRRIRLNTAQYER